MAGTTEPGLVFVYNANSGLLNLLVGATHRVVRPSTYPCRLCAVTYAFSGMRREWKEFVDGLGRPVEFLHRDELMDRYGVEGVPLPAGFVRRGAVLSLWISADEINRCRSLDDLKRLVSDRMAELPGDGSGAAT